MKTGNLFHSAGPANAKARFTNFLIDRVTTKSASDKDRRDNYCTLPSNKASSVDIIIID